MKFSLLFLFLIINSLIFAQPIKNFQPDRKSIKDFDLKGNISKVELVRTYPSEEKENITYLFNEKGFLTHLIREKDTTQIFYYDNQFNLVKGLFFYENKWDTMSYKVDKNKNIQETCKNSTCWNYKWEKNKLLGDYEYWTFDTKGNIAEALSVSEVTSYEYNKANQKISEEIYSVDDDDWFYKIKFTYNKMNNIASVEASDESENVTLTNTYEYDKIGNWIQKKTFDMGSYTTENRTITYLNDVPAAKSGKKK